MNMKSLSLTGVAVLAALALGACSDSTVSSEELSDQVQSSLEETVGAPLESVDCPEVPAETGETFSCEATEPNGNTVNVEGEITEVDSDTDRVNFTVQVVP